MPRGPFIWSSLRLHPETHAGGFSKVDGTVEFFSRVQAILPGHGFVLDLGAGRGQWQEDTCVWRRNLADLRGPRRLVVAADIDSTITEHAGVDAAVLLPPHGGLPFRDQSFDMVVADWVLEHVVDPAGFANELRRVVSPGGWICARTPNKWGYVGIGARLIPNLKHVDLLERLQPERHERDVFPVSYRLNTRRTIAHFFVAAEWNNYSYVYNPDVDYVGESFAAGCLVQAWQWIVPNPLATALHIFLQRRPIDDTPIESP